jgi:hypothetical protein
MPDAPTTILSIMNSENSPSAPLHAPLTAQSLYSPPLQQVELEPSLNLVQYITKLFVSSDSRINLEKLPPDQKTQDELFDRLAHFWNNFRDLCQDSISLEYMTNPVINIETLALADRRTFVENAASRETRNNCPVSQQPIKNLMLVKATPFKTLLETAGFKMEPEAKSFKDLPRKTSARGQKAEIRSNLGYTSQKDQYIERMQEILGIEETKSNEFELLYRFCCHIQFPEAFTAVILNRTIKKVIIERELGHSLDSMAAHIAKCYRPVNARSDDEYNTDAYIKIPRSLYTIHIAATENNASDLKTQLQSKLMQRLNPIIDADILVTNASDKACSLFYADEKGVITKQKVFAQYSPESSFKKFTIEFAKIDTSEFQLITPERRKLMHKAGIKVSRTFCNTHLSRHLSPDDKKVLLEHLANFWNQALKQIIQVEEDKQVALSDPYIHIRSGKIVNFDQAVADNNKQYVPFRSLKDLISYAGFPTSTHIASVENLPQRITVKDLFFILFKYCVEKQPREFKFRTLISEFIVDIKKHIGPGANLIRILKDIRKNLKSSDQNFNLNTLLDTLIKDDNVKVLYNTCRKADKIQCFTEVFANSAQREEFARLLSSINNIRDTQFASHFAHVSSLSSSSFLSSSSLASSSSASSSLASSLSSSSSSASSSLSSSSSASSPLSSSSSASSPLSSSSSASSPLSSFSSASSSLSSFSSASSPLSSFSSASSPLSSFSSASSPLSSFSSASPPLSSSPLSSFSSASSPLSSFSSASPPLSSSSSASSSSASSSLVAPPTAAPLLSSPSSTSSASSCDSLALLLSAAEGLEGLANIAIAAQYPRRKPGRPRIHHPRVLPSQGGQRKKRLRDEGKDEDREWTPEDEHNHSRRKTTPQTKGSHSTLSSGAGGASPSPQLPLSSSSTPSRAPSQRTGAITRQNTQQQRQFGTMFAASTPSRQPTNPLQHNNSLPPNDDEDVTAEQLFEVHVYGASSDDDKQVADSKKIVNKNEPIVIVIDSDTEAEQPPLRLSTSNPPSAREAHALFRSPSPVTATRELQPPVQPKDGLIDIDKGPS